MAKIEKSKLRKVAKILCFMLLVILGLQGATQYIAFQFGYAQSLGEPLIRMNSGTSIYGFWKGLEWFFALKSHYGTHDGITRVFGIAGYISAGVLLFAVVAMRFLFRRAGISANETLHGSARWAELNDIIRAALLRRRGKENAEGVVVGGWVDSIDKEDTKQLKVLRDNSLEHILVFAPTRSGKGVGLILPTLLGEWKGSTIVLDIKGENWALTAGYKKTLGHEVYKFDPSDPTAATMGTSVTFNPLEEIPLQYKVDFEKNTFEDLKEKETATIQAMVETIANPKGELKEDHWSMNAKNVIVGAITHLLYVGLRNGYRPCLADIIEELTQEQNKYGDIFRAWSEYPHLGYDEKTKLPIVHPVVRSIADTMLPPNKSEDGKEGGSIVGTAISYLILYQDPIIADNTRVSSFKIKDLMNKKTPVHLYLVINPIDIVRLKPLLRIMLTQIINTLAPKEALEASEGRMVRKAKHRLLFMLDEFPALGRLEGFKEAVGFVAGFGMKLYIITQSLSQLYGAYERYDTQSIAENCRIQIAYAAASQETAEMLSAKTGTTTIVKESVSTSGKRTDVFLDQTSVSMQEYSRPLLTPNECMTLQGAKKNDVGDIEVPGEMLIFPTGLPAILGRQTLYFKDKTLSERSKIEAPIICDHGIDIVKEQKKVAEIKKKLRDEKDEIRVLTAEIGKLEEDDPKRKEKEAKIKQIKDNRKNARPSQSIGLPVHRN